MSPLWAFAHNGKVKRYQANDRYIIHTWRISGIELLQFAFAHIPVVRICAQRRRTVSRYHRVEMRVQWLRRL